MQVSKQDIDKLLSQSEPRLLNSVLFNLAHSYSRVSDMALDAISSTQDADFAAPAIMCKSFSIELLLKFFIIISHPNIQTKTDLDSSKVNLRGHQYSKLYDKIDLIYKTKIAQSFNCISGQQVNEITFKNVLIDIGDDPFVFWRYIYEKDGKDGRFHHLDLVLFNNVLHAMGKAAEAERKRIVDETK